MKEMYDNCTFGLSCRLSMMPGWTVLGSMLCAMHGRRVLPAVVRNQWFLGP